jgi:hypothetical protein
MAGVPEESAAIARDAKRIFASVLPRGSFSTRERRAPARRRRTRAPAFAKR